MPFSHSSTEANNGWQLLFSQNLKTNIQQKLYTYQDFYSEFEDKTIEEESITFSISATNFRITGLLRGLRIVPFAT